MPRVAVDVDDTIYSFTTLAREVICQMVKENPDHEYVDCLIRASYAPWTEWRTPSDLMPLDLWIEVVDRCHEDEVIWQQPPFRGAKEVLWRLIEAGHDITYVSNRREKTRGATSGWLEANGFPSSISWDRDAEDLGERVSLVCAGNGPKTEHVADCQYIIDDRPKTLVQFVYDHDWKSENPELRRLGFGLHTDSNGALTDIPGIYLAKTWSLLETYLERKSII